MMRILFRLSLAAAVTGALLGGCGTLKKFTGQRNDTVLPGERENILSPDQQVNQEVDVKGAKKASPGPADAKPACDPNVEDCPPEPDTIDQEAGAN